MEKNALDDLAKTLAEIVPDGLRSVRDDLETNFKSILRSGLSKLDLVTREEFDVQQAVLAKTRDKLELLEQRLSRLDGTESQGTNSDN